MPRALTPERQQELDSLRAILLVIADFQRPHFDGKFAHIPDMMVEAIEKTYRERSLTEMRMLRDDMVAMSEDCTAEQMRRLDAMLRERAGISLNDLHAKRLARIAKVRERGRITSETQYYLVREHVELIWSDPAREEEFRALQNIMVAYEERVVRAAERKKAGGR